MDKLSEQAKAVKKAAQPQTMSEETHFQEGGYEYVSSDPVAIPARLQRQQTELERITQLMGIARANASEGGFESPDEADDFDVPDEDEVFRSSPYEFEDDFDHLHLDLEAVQDPRKNNKEEASEGLPSGERPSETSGPAKPDAVPDE